jgi:hypothetical protein
LAPSGDGILPVRHQKTCKPVPYSLENIILNLEGKKRDQKRGNKEKGIKKKEEKNRENRKENFDEHFLNLRSFTLGFMSKKYLSTPCNL